MKPLKQIARELGADPSNTRKVLRSAMGKAYRCIRKDVDCSPFEAALILVEMTDLGEDDKDWSEFFNAFPPDIRDEIRIDAAFRSGLEINL